MPIPKPRREESREEFVSRFMSNNEMKEEYPNEEQRISIAYQKWRDRNKKEGELLNLEYKGFELNIKSFDEKGIFEGTASPFNNVDLGNDRVLKSIVPRNNKKTIPYLWQHDSKNIIGEVTLIGNESGMDFKGNLFLDTLGNGQPAIPDAWKAYTLMKNKRLKNSIGYCTLDYDYVMEGKTTVRNLKDIDIMELSAVTFPMNPKATISNVKSEGGNKMNLEEKMEKLEEKMDKTFNILVEQKQIDEEFNKVKAYISKLKPDDPKYISLAKYFNKSSKDPKDDGKEEEKKSDTIDLETKEAFKKLLENMKDNKED